MQKMPQSSPQKPSATTAPPSPLPHFLSGLPVEIQLTTGQSLAGLVFAYSTASNTLTLLLSEESAGGDPLNPTKSMINPTVGSFSIVRVSQIQQVQILPHRDEDLEANRRRMDQLLLLGNPASQTHSVVKKINVEKLKFREMRAVQQIEERLAKVGVGVSEEAQSVFDFLSRTMPCRWQKDIIIVMEEVWVRPPYTKDDVDGQETGSAGISHVKKILEHRAQRLKQK